VTDAVASGDGGGADDSTSPVLSSLANERNLLAWQRTAMSWGGAGAVVTRYFATDGLLRPQTVVGMLMLVVGALMWLDGARRYHRVADALRVPGAHGVAIPLTTIRVVWLSTVTVTVAATVVEVLT
jgi:uncharacterized membrane protein YidH (DUF202 family)